MTDDNYMIQRGYNEWKSRREAKQAGIKEGRAMTKTKTIYKKEDKKKNPFKKVDNYLNRKVAYKSIVKKTPRATYVIRF